MDQDGQPDNLEYLEVNPAYEKISGLKAADIVGKMITEIYPNIKAEPSDWIKEWGKVALTGHSKMDEKYFGPSGKWYQFTAYSPQPGLVALVTIDITARKKAEAEQRRHTEELAATNRELQDFTNSVAHDFRSPLVNLKGFSKELESLLEDIKKAIHEDVGCISGKTRDILETEMPEALNFIQAAVDRLDRMVNALLQLARVCKREMACKEVDCAELIKGVVESFEHQIVDAGVDIKVGPMPIIKSDSLALEQIFGNLVDNAIKYIDSDRSGKIEIGCIFTEGYYLFHVSDNGRGVTESDRDKIFEMFRRGGRQEIPGDGPSFRTELGGRIWCESELGRGTKMQFTLYKRNDEL